MLVLIKALSQAQRYRLCLLLCLLIQSCSTLKPQVDFSQYQWRAEGKMSMRLKPEGSDKFERQQFSFRWTQAEQAALLDIFSPLGARVLMIESVPSGATLTDQKGRVQQGSSMADLLWHNTGLLFPIDSFSGWIFADQEASVRALFAHQSGQAANTLSSWQIDRLQYVDGYLKRIALNDAEGNQLLLIVKSLQF